MLAWALSKRGVEFEGIDINSSVYTMRRVPITDENAVTNAVQGSDTALYPEIPHKPHVKSHTRQDFIDTKVRISNSFGRSNFGHAMRPIEGGSAVWVDENLVPRQKNIYGATKLAAEELCSLAHQ